MTMRRCDPIRIWGGVDSRIVNVWGPSMSAGGTETHEGMLVFINPGTINGDISASFPGNRDESLEISVGHDE